ncbi:dimeric alpha-beta barrel containing protein [Colletotrichum plurivorum]|uniref:Dimeric alpha-beta barrel containing protein n=1 Tax=Colletotrichum plurivorum TaxID=2175906 RepID=A0A8H6U4S8_9PEZI|nr:dimeric alpha-beta barrel containing protein [Colletotrichum plurivorum]
MSGPPAAGVTERMLIPVCGTKEDWKEPLKAYLLALKNQDGYLRTRWGPWTENEQILDLISGWKTKEARDAFFASAEYKDVMADFKTVMTGDIKSYFIKFVPYAPRGAIDSPIAEVITISGATVSEDELRAQIDKARSIPGLNDLASGFSVDDVDGGKVFVAALGWESVEKSQAADKSAYIPANGKVEAHHVNFHYPVKGFSVTNTH